VRAPQSDLLPRFAADPLGLVVALQAGLLTALSGGYGFHRDELCFRGRPLGLGLRRPTAYYPLLARAATAIFGDTPMGLRVAATLAAVAPIVRELGGGRGA
jgi:hypothetical protein